MKNKPTMVPVMKPEMRVSGAMNECMRDMAVGSKCKMLVEGTVTEQRGLPEKPEYGDQHSTTIQIDRVSRADKGKAESTETDERTMPHRPRPVPRPYRKD